MQIPPSIAYVQHYYRKRIETVGSLIERLLPKTMHAVTAQGYELKVFLFGLAYSLNCLEVATWVNLGRAKGEGHSKFRRLQFNNFAI